MDKLRWGILGTARINRLVIPALHASPNNELVAVASRNLSHGQDYAAQWEIPQALGSYQELINSDQIDVVYIPLPNHMHAEWTIKAAEAGKHVLCEKPLALSVSEVDSIRASAEKNSVKIVEAFMYRHHPQTLKVRDLIESGALGQIGYMRGTFSFILDRPGNIRWSPETGGGSLWDIGCYPVSYAQMVMGSAPVELFASQVIGPSGVDLSFTGQMHYPNEGFAQIQSSFVLPYYSSIEIRGTKGTIIVPDPYNPKTNETRIIVIRENDREELKFYYPHIYQGEIEDLAEVIRSQKPPRLPLSESRDIIATLTGLYRSAIDDRPLQFNQAGYSL
jgi:xylose dehydrogenase (NAD/NADP)